MSEDQSSSCSPECNRDTKKILALVKTCVDRKGGPGKDFYVFPVALFLIMVIIQLFLLASIFFFVWQNMISINKIIVDGVPTLVIEE